MKNASTALSPLADPVVAAIFSSASSAGLAAGSLIRAVLEEDGISIGKVISVTPQHFNKNEADKRGCRIDVLVETDRNEAVIIEVQMNADRHILERDLFEASHIFVEAAPDGIPTRKLSEVLPKIIAINILDYDIRSDNTDVVQPIKLIFTKEPNRVATDYLAIYNVSLKRFREKKPDFKKPLDCWLYAMDTARQNEMTLTEVVAMTPSLESYVKKDPGFVQYIKRYKAVADDEEIREEYFRWRVSILREEGMRLGAIEEGLEQGREEGREEGMKWGMERGIKKGIEQGLKKGREEGREEGEIKKAHSIARNMFAINIPLEQIVEATGLTQAEVEELCQ